MTSVDRVTYSRQKFLLDSFEFKESRVLEIGPLNKPLITKENFGETCEIFSLDHLSTENLKIKYADTASVNTDDIVSIDYVCPDGDISKAVDGNKLTVKRGQDGTTKLAHIRGTSIKSITSADNALVEEGDDFGFSGTSTWNG